MIGASMRGPALIVLALFLFALLDAVGKHLAASFDQGQVVLLRYLPVLLIALPIALARQRIGSRRHGLHALRALLMALASVGFFHGFRFLPLADGYLVYFTSPFITMAAAHLLLREHVPPRAWMWAGVGFAGVMVAVADGLSGGGPWHAYLAVFLSTLLYAGVVTLNRLMRTETDLVALLLWPGLVGTIVLGPMALFDWRPAGWTDSLLMLLNGALWAGATLCMVAAFRHAPASRLAPLEYSALLWAVLLDWVVWSTVPSPLVLGGGAIVVFACIMAARAQGIPAGKT
jgi:drug/metabolite transporter (DMT)-like permease